jgi:hypothetical protein
MFFTLIISLLLILWAYAIVSRKDGSMLNWLTPAVALGIPAHFLFPYLYTLFFQTDASLYSQIYCYACYVAMIVVSALVYRWIKFPALGWRGPRPETRWAHWIILGLSLLVFAPVLIQFRAQLLDPRSIYQETRGGYGLTFFGSAALLDIAVILFLFRKSHNIILDSLFWILTIASCLEHGSKGQLLTFFWIWLLYKVYVERRSFRVLQAARIAVFGAFAVVGSFLLFGNAQLAELIESVSKYADYNRNAALVIDDPNRPLYFGQLAIEDEFYSRIPRAIFPNKPTLFGAFRLIHYYFPDAASDDWAPDFGMGFPYADFGPLAIFYVALCAMLGGMGCSIFIHKLRTDPNPGNLTMLVFFAGVSFLPTGIGYMLPEHLVLSGMALLVTRIPRVRLFPRLVVAAIAPP